MNEFSRIFRLWSFVTAAFIFLAAGLVAIFFAYRIYLFEQDGQEAQKRLIEAQLKGQYGKIVEEVYLHLEATDARQAILQDLLGTKGKLSLQVLYHTPAQTSSRPDQPMGKWRREVGNRSDTYLLPLNFGDLHVADLVATVRWTGLLSLTEAKGILVGIGGVVGLLCLAWFFAFFILQRRVISPLIAEVIDLQRTAAIAKTTQMLAHDVRKPFSILKMGLGMLGNAKDPASMKALLSRLLPEVDRAVSSVNGMISDVMEIGSTSSELIQEPATAESLVESALTETFRAYPKSEVSISYSFEHTHLVSVHVAKINRVFANIVSNAVQAMGRRGELWIKTRDRDGLIEFCIGNAGSYIPPENLPRLFEAFFTSGKKGGTGLGLAIAHKMVTAHGGRIWCRSAKTPAHPEGQVEFFFTLPAAKEPGSTGAMGLPRHSSEFVAALQASAMTLGDPTGTDPVERSLEMAIACASTAMGRPLRVLVVDDEAVYRGALVAFLARSGTLASAVTVREADGVDKAMQLLRETAADLIITDVDMGRDTGTGFDLVRSIRSAGIQALVCVHSNRVVAADNAKAIEAGADAFVPKPMARAQLLRLLLQAADRQAASTEAALAKPEVLIVEDNPFVLEAWERCLAADAKVHTATSVRALRAKLQVEPGLIDRLACVVTDLYLDDDSGDGRDVGKIIKAARSEIPVHLSSDGNLSLADLGGTIDTVIGKDPIALALLQKCYGKRSPDSVQHQGDASDLGTIFDFAVAITAGRLTR